MSTAPSSRAVVERRKSAPDAQARLTRPDDVAVFAARMPRRAEP